MTNGMHCFTTATLRGVLCMVIGLLLLLHTLGLFHAWLNIILMVGAFGLIVYGALAAQVPQEVMKLIKSAKKE